MVACRLFEMRCIIIGNCLLLLRWRGGNAEQVVKTGSIQKTESGLEQSYSGSQICFLRSRDGGKS